MLNLDAPNLAAAKSVLCFYVWQNWGYVSQVSWPWPRPVFFPSDWLVTAPAMSLWNFPSSTWSRKAVLEGGRTHALFLNFGVCGTLWNTTRWLLLRCFGTFFTFQTKMFSSKWIKSVGNSKGKEIASARRERRKGPFASLSPQECSLELGVGGRGITHSSFSLTHPTSMEYLDQRCHNHRNTGPSCPVCWCWWLGVPVYPANSLLFFFKVYLEIFLIKILASLVW